MELRYGLNPDQPACVEPVVEGRWPLQVVSGAPSMINLLDALQGWQLVREAAAALEAPAAASIKHVSPAGAATAGPLDTVMEETWGVGTGDVSPVASAYVRARDADPKCSFGDVVAVSAPVDATLAELLARLVCDAIVAPGYEPGTVERLAAKKGGTFLVLEADAAYEPEPWERRDVFGLRLTQSTRRTPITRSLIREHAPGAIGADALDATVLALITARYTQSNTVTYAREGMVLGVGAGQQSRVDCTRLAGQKVDLWWLRRHVSARGLGLPDTISRQDRLNWIIRYLQGDLMPGERAELEDLLGRCPEPLSNARRAEWLDRLDGVALASDGFIPFRDNIDEAARHGVRSIAEPGGSTRGAEVEQACIEHGIDLIRTGVRLFQH
jgi:phosphoribosylaminoimidazolecarboxamide formyltransferase/IMP cyclohydrolase